MPKKSTKSTATSVNNPDLLKIGEASRLLGKSVSTLRDWCSQGLLKPVVFESGHRLFHINEVIAMKAKTEPKPETTEINYVQKAKQMREQRKEKLEFITKELKKFDGIATGIKLEVKEEIYLNTDDDTVRPWITVGHDGHVIFVANHYEGEVYEFKNFQHLHPKTKFYPGLDDMFANILPKESRTVITAKIHGVKKGTLDDLFNSLSKQIANL
jgi:DNA-binding transcriptional MerR regulator